LIECEDNNNNSYSCRLGDGIGYAKCVKEKRERSEIESERAGKRMRERAKH